MFFQLNIKSEPLSDEAYDDGVVIDGAYREEVCGFFSMCYLDIRFALFVVNESAVWSQGQMVRSLWNRKQAWADKVV